jgi:hypothetical protein
MFYARGVDRTRTEDIDDRAMATDIDVKRSRGDGCERKTECSGVLART